MDSAEPIVVDPPAPTPPQPAAQTSTQPTAGPSNGETSYPTRSKSGGGSNIPRLKIAPPGASSSKAEPSRITRSAVPSKPKIQATKLKLKLGEKLAAQAPGMSFLGPYDRELDSDEEELAFEEHFILRMPEGEDCDKLRKMVSSREVSGDVWFKFKDSRRAMFHVGNNTYSAKLVDLPSIIESQKTLDNKQMFKVADICQMLLVEKPISGDDSSTQQKSFNIEEFVYPHGLTPPLRHVRKRRFRKRVNRRTIESVEQEVERLLDEDTLAADVQYDVLENVNPDLSDSEFIEREDTAEPAATPAAASDGGDAPTPAHGDQDEDDEDDGDIDEELAAELDMALEDDDSESGDEDSGDESAEDIDSGDEEQSQARKLLSEEIRDLENAVSKKEKEVASTTNPLIKKRFEDTLKKLNADLEAKRAHRDDMDEKARKEKEGITEPEKSGEDEDAGEQSGDDLFGDDDMDLS